MTVGESQKRLAQRMEEACEGGRYQPGDSRKPHFGEWMRGIWASEKNPHRDGMYVRTIRRTGRLNPGTYYELTDGKGDFWQYQREGTIFLGVSQLYEA